MNSAVAPLVREHVVSGVEGGAHGIAVVGRRLFVAAGFGLFRLAPESGRVVDELETNPSPGGLAYNGRHLWQLSEGRVQEVEVRTGFVVRSLGPELDDVTGIECLDDDLLLLHAGGRSLARVETLDATVVAKAETDVPLRGLTWASGSLLSSTEGSLVRVDPASARILDGIRLPQGLRIWDLASDVEGRIWCVDGKTPVVRAFVW